MIKIIIKFYRLFISSAIAPRCRFIPTCSHYAEDAFKEFGLFKGGFMVMKRILKCNPLFKGGFDPVHKWQIRKAAEADVVEIFRIVNEAYLVEKEGGKYGFKNADRYNDLGEAKQDIDKGTFLVCVEPKSQEIAGCIFYDMEGDIGEFGPFAVSPKYQKLGVGSLLMFEIEKILKKEGCTKIVIKVVDLREDLISYYPKKGYIQKGSSPDGDKYNFTADNVIKEARLLDFEKGV